MADKAFINDASDEDDISQYWKPTKDVFKEGGRYAAENINIASNVEADGDDDRDSIRDYLPDDDEVIDAIDLADVEGGDDDFNDFDWSKEPPDMAIYEVNNLTGVNLTPEDIQMMNTKIDEVIIKSVGVNGYCTYEAVLNGLYMHRHWHHTSGCGRVVENGKPTIILHYGRIQRATTVYTIAEYCRCVG